MFDLARFDSEGNLDLAATADRLLVEYPNLDSSIAKRSLEAVVGAIKDILPGKRKRPQYVWLFNLAGRLKGLYPAEEQSLESVAESNLPYALLFADIASYSGYVDTKNRIDWSDRDAVEIEFLQAWSARKLPINSSAVELAAEYAFQNPLELNGNKYLILIVNMGFFLQTQYPDFPFILPVNGKIAALLNTTVPTIGSSVTRAIKEGFFIVVGEKYSISARKARTFNFNFSHPKLSQSVLVRRYLSEQGHRELK